MGSELQQLLLPQPTTLRYKGHAGRMEIGVASFRLLSFNFCLLFRVWSCLQKASRESSPAKKAHPQRTGTPTTRLNNSLECLHSHLLSAVQFPVAYSLVSVFTTSVLGKLDCWRHGMTCALLIPKCIVLKRHVDDFIFQHNWL